MCLTIDFFKRRGFDEMVQLVIMLIFVILILNFMHLFIYLASTLISCKMSNALPECV